MLIRVTITGADESVHPRELAEISHDFPFVEWGILVSFNRQGEHPRYPSFRWREQLSGLELQLAAHLCGRAVAEFRAGAHPWAQRIQLNGVLAAAESAINLSRHIAAAEQHGDNRMVIIQARNPTEIQMASNHVARARGKNVGMLVDASGGCGIVPEEWPKIRPEVEHGFAGGIGPENVEAVLREVTARPGMSWIDMETRVRSRDDRRFDLALVRDVLSKARPFIGVMA